MVLGVLAGWCFVKSITWKAWMLSRSTILPVLKSWLTYLNMTARRGVFMAKLQAPKIQLLLTGKK